MVKYFKKRCVFFLAIGLSGTSCVTSKNLREIENNVRVPVVISNASIRAHSLAERMNYFEVPGVSVAAIDQGKIVWAKGYGLLEEGKDQKVSTETVFQAASMSKPVAALGILSLVKSGKINLDANVNHYLKSWKVPENAFTKNQKVTIRRLLSHTAGLIDGSGFPGYQKDAPLPSLLEILDAKSPKVDSKPVVVGTIPGSFFQYSGGGYEILQLVIEDLTGKSFAEFMKETILQPLEMTHSTFEYPLSERLASNAASAHNRKEVVNGKWHVYPEKAAAALWTTPSDMAKMIISVHNCVQGIGDNKGLFKILGLALCREMLTMRQWPLQNGQTQKIGLGFMVEDGKFEKTFHHAGGNEGIKCNFRGVTSKNVLHGTVVMTNSSRGSHLIDELEKTIDDVYGWVPYKSVERN